MSIKWSEWPEKKKIYKQIFNISQSKGQSNRYKHPLMNKIWLRAPTQKGLFYLC